MTPRLRGLLAGILLFTPVTTSAEETTQLNLSSGYDENIFADSSATSDTYASFSPTVRFYPAASLEVTLEGSYKAYQDNSDLGSLYGGAGVSFIPTRSRSRFSVLISGNLFTRRYGDIFDIYNYQGFGLAASTSLKLRTNIRLRAGASLNTADYVNSESGDHNGLDLYGGINFTPFGSNALDLTGGYLRYAYTTDSELQPTGPPRGNSGDDADNENRYDVLYFSGRLSRPLGARTGLKLTWSEQHFVKEDDPVTYGFSVDILSPWTSVWEGRTVLVSLKNFSIPNVILQTGFSHNEREYIATYDYLTTSSGIILVEFRREDTRYKTWLSIQRPINLSPGRLLKPTVSVEYRDNQSNEPLYDYTGLAINASVDLKF